MNRKKFPSANMYLLSTYYALYIHTIERGRWTFTAPFPKKIRQQKLLPSITQQFGMAAYKVFEIFETDFIENVIENILKEDPEEPGAKNIDCSYGVDYKRPFESSSLYWFLYKGK